MRLIPWMTPFTDVKWLICESLQSDCEFALELRPVEHQVIDAEAPQTLPEDPVDRLIAQSNPIVETSDSRKWLVNFEHVVAFRSESESYSFKPHWPEPEVRCTSYVLDESPWIEEIDAQLLEDLVPGCRHYVILTSHVIIEVISPHEPFVS